MAARQGRRNATERVNALTTTLKDTNDNLRAVERMLRDLDKSRSRSISVHAAVQSADSGEARVSGRVSDSDDNRSEAGSVGHHRSSSATGGNRDIHSIHQSLRDIALEQKRLSQELAKSLSKKTISSPSANTFSPQDSEVIERVDRRLQRIDDEMRAERQSRQEELAKISSELKGVVKNGHIEWHESQEGPHRSPDRNQSGDLRETLFRQVDELKHTIAQTQTDTRRDTEMALIKDQLTRLNIAVNHPPAIQSQASITQDRPQRSQEPSMDQRDQASQDWREIVDMWRSQNEQLQRELQQQKEFTSRQEMENALLKKETDEHRSRSADYRYQLDQLMKEFNNLVALKVSLDEKLSSRDEELSEAGVSRRELEQELRRLLADKQSADHRLQLANEKLHIYGHQEPSRNQQNAARLENNSLRQELDQALLADKKLRKEIDQLMHDKQGLLNELSKVSFRSESSSSEQQRALDGHEAAMLRQRLEFQDQVSAFRDRLLKLEKEKCDYLTENEGLRVALSEQKSMCALLQSREACLHEDVDRLERDLASSLEECSRLQTEVVRKQRELGEAGFELSNTKDEMNRMRQICDRLGRARDLSSEEIPTLTEDSFIRSRRGRAVTRRDGLEIGLQLAMQKRNHDNELSSIATQMDDVLSKCGSDAAKSGVGEEANFEKVSRKVEAVKRCMENMTEKKQRMRSESVSDARDCKFLLDEITRHKETLKYLAAERKSETRSREGSLSGGISRWGYADGYVRDDRYSRLKTAGKQRRADSMENLCKEQRTRSAGPRGRI